MVKSNLAYKAQDTVVPEVVVNESPIKWCAVALSDVIARGKRLEASVFDVEAKQARSLIAKGKYTQSFIGGASGMASSYVCGRFKRIWVEKSDMPIYQPSSIVDIKPTPDGYISAKTKTNIGNLRVKENQILMTCSGTIGKVSFVSRTLANKIFSHDLLRIDCRKPDEAGYIYALEAARQDNLSADTRVTDCRHFLGIPLQMFNDSVNNRHMVGGVKSSGHLTQPYAEGVHRGGFFVEANIKSVDIRQLQLAD